MSGAACPTNFGPAIEGNAVVVSIPNAHGNVIPVVGLSTTWDNGVCGDPSPSDSSEHPLLGTDLRTDHRK